MKTSEPYEMWGVCPKCGGEIEYDDYEYDYSIWQPQYCTSCGFEFQAVYEFVGYETQTCIPLDSSGNIIDYENEIGEQNENSL